MTSSCKWPIGDTRHYAGYVSWLRHQFKIHPQARAKSLASIFQLDAVFVSILFNFAARGISVLINTTFILESEAWG